MDVGDAGQLAIQVGQELEAARAAVGLGGRVVEDEVAHGVALPVGRHGRRQRRGRAGVGLGVVLAPPRRRTQLQGQRARASRVLDRSGQQAALRIAAAGPRAARVVAVGEGLAARA